VLCPAIARHRPENFHLRYTFKYVTKPRGLDATGWNKGTEHALACQKKVADREAGMQRV